MVSVDEPGRVRVLFGSAILGAFREWASNEVSAWCLGRKVARTRPRQLRTAPQRSLAIGGGRTLADRDGCLPNDELLEAPLEGSVRKRTVKSLRVRRPNRLPTPALAGPSQALGPPYQNIHPVHPVVSVWLVLTNGPAARDEQDAKSLYRSGGTPRKSAATSMRSSRPPGDCQTRSTACGMSLAAPGRDT